MAANHNIHTPDDDNYYYCPNNNCPCHDNTAAYYDGADNLVDALNATTNTSPCHHYCCSAAVCNCPKCFRDCPTCHNISDHYNAAFNNDNYQHHDNDCPICHPDTTG